MSEPARRSGVIHPRRVRLVLRPEGVRVVVRQLIDDVHLAAKIRGQFDEDRDGALGPGERERMQNFLVGRTLRILRLRVERRLLPLLLDAGSVHGADVATSLPGRLSVNAILEARHRFGSRSCLDYTDFGSGDGRQLSLEVHLSGLGLLGCSSGRVSRTQEVGQSIRGVFLEAGQTWTIELASREALAVPC